jgi:hypothetical protein
MKIRGDISTGGVSLFSYDVKEEERERSEA